MKEPLRKLAAIAEERQRGLQAAAGIVCAGVGSAWVAGAGWALIIIGGLLLGDLVLAARQPRRPGATP